MKYLFVVVILCAAVGLSQQVLTKQKLEEMLFKLMHDCAKRESASKADIAYLAERNPPSTREQKCMSACVGETVGLIKNHHPSVDMARKLAKNAFGADDPKVDLAIAIAKECVDVTDPDRCEAAAKMYDCGRKGAEKRGIKFENFM